MKFSELVSGFRTIVYWIRLDLNDIVAIYRIPCMGKYRLIAI